jgi:hypothetical protein
MNSSPAFPNVFVASSDDKDPLDTEGSDGESIGEHFSRYTLRDRLMRSMRTLTPIPVKLVARKPMIVEADFLPMSGVAEYGFISRGLGSFGTIVDPLVAGDALKSHLIKRVRRDINIAMLLSTRVALSLWSYMLGRLRSIVPSLSSP